MTKIESNETETENVMIDITNTGDTNSQISKCT